MNLEEFNKAKLMLEDIMISNNFTSCNYTINQKNLMIQSFIKILEEYPEEMCNYLLKDIRGKSLQNKIFKSYVKLLEKSLPIYFNKGKLKYKISSINDPDLNLFSNQESFQQIVNNKFKIKNNTSKIYIGGRKSSYVKPYYIGKLIDVIKLDTNTSLLSQVEDYTFSYIKMKNVKPGTKVEVIHLPVPPHYQMGPMVYLNRIKQEIKKIR